MFEAVIYCLMHSPQPIRLIIYGYRVLCSRYVFGGATLASALAISAYIYQKYVKYNQAAYEYYKTIYASKQYEETIRGLYEYAKTHKPNEADIHPNMPLELDIVCSGGGFKCAYGLGVFLGIAVCKEIKIVRYSGTSAGAHILYYALSSQIDKIFNFCYSALKTIEKYPALHPFKIWNDFFRLNSTNRYLPAPGTLFVSVSKLVSIVPLLLNNETVSSFASLDQLRNTLMATAGIPFVTYRSVWERIGSSRLLDGGLTANTPYFRDRIRDQLVIDLQYLPSDMHGRSFLQSIIYWKLTDIIRTVRLGVDDVIRVLVDGPDSLQHKRIQLIRKDAQDCIEKVPEVDLSTLLNAYRSQVLNT